MKVCLFGMSRTGWLRLVGSFKIIGLLCRISSRLQGSFAKETYHLKESALIWNERTYCALQRHVVRHVCVYIATTQFNVSD